MDKIRVRLIIEGRVHGVWFRESTRREANRLGLTGWVKNRADGTVGVLMEGPEEKVEKLVAWCRHGPPAADVRGVRETRDDWQGEFQSFDVVF
jgi:acylphosphatase